MILTTLEKTLLEVYFELNEKKRAGKLRGKVSRKKKRASGKLLKGKKNLQ